jgi:peptidoglycan/xylan/chitin deacetylase (PgdA/CDA1 family)
MNAACTVLMYHATHRHDAELGGADAHYAVTLDTFEAHLDCLAQEGAVACAVERVPALGAAGQRTVGMTFDDGHATNLQAAQALAKRGWSGTFFVNPSTVGNPDFLSWDALRAMAAMGMSIQSHAQHHRYQNELTQAEQLDELSQSKAAIEAQLGTACTVFAPPGGRTTPDTVRLARHAGYGMVSTSRVGLWDLRRADPWDVPRFAVLAGTPMAQLRAWVRQSPLEVGKQVLRYRALRTVKQALGNGGYERLRAALLPPSKDN